MLLGRSWSRLERLLGSWLSAWYCPLSLSPVKKRKSDDGTNVIILTRGDLSELHQVDHVDGGYVILPAR